MAGLTFDQWIAVVGALGTISGSIILGLLYYQGWGLGKQERERFRLQQGGEIKRAHYRVLIEGSISHWRYNPLSEGEQITRPSDIPNIDASPPYLERAKAHLCYYDLWRLYELGPSLVRDANSRHLLFQSDIRGKLVNGIKDKGLEINNVEDLVSNVSSDIETRLNGEIVPGAIVFTYEAVEEEAIYSAATGLPPVRINSGHPIDSSLKHAKVFAGLATGVKADEGVRKEFKDYHDSLDRVNNNRKEFMRRLQNEVVDAVRLSDYKEMKGTCDLGY